MLAACALCSQWAGLAGTHDALGSADSRNSAQCQGGHLWEQCLSSKQCCQPADDRDRQAAWAATCCCQALCKLLQRRWPWELCLTLQPKPSTLDPRRWKLPTQAPGSPSSTAPAHTSRACGTPSTGAPQQSANDARTGTAEHACRGPPCAASAHGSPAREPPAPEPGSRRIAGPAPPAGPRPRWSPCPQQTFLQAAGTRAPPGHVIAKSELWWNCSHAGFGRM